MDEENFSERLTSYIKPLRGYFWNYKDAEACFLKFFMGTTEEEREERTWLRDKLMLNGEREGDTPRNVLLEKLIGELKRLIVGDRPAVSDKLTAGLFAAKVYGSMPRKGDNHHMKLVNRITKTMKVGLSGKRDEEMRAILIKAF